MQAKVAVMGRLRFPPERVQDVLPHLKAMVEATRRHDGCIAYDIAADLFEPGVIRVSELWPDHASLERHISAPHVLPWREAAQACGIVEKSYTIYDLAGAREV